MEYASRGRSCEEVNEVEFYSNVHSYDIQREEGSLLKKLRIAGGLPNETLQRVKRFHDRAAEIFHVASEIKRQVFLFVDAE